MTKLNRSLPGGQVRLDFHTSPHIGDLLVEFDVETFADTFARAYGLTVHLRQLPTPCRHDAVAFGHRPVNFGLTGTFTPQCERLHRRTSAGFSPLQPATGDWVKSGRRVRLLKVKRHECRVP